MPVIELGDVARDKITSFEGVVVCEARWLHGCVRLTLQPRSLHEGKTIPSETFDAPQLELVSKGHYSKASTGGPRPEPTRGR